MLKEASIDDFLIFVNNDIMLTQKLGGDVWGKAFCLGGSCLLCFPCSSAPGNRYFTDLFCGF